MVLRDLLEHFIVPFGMILSEILKSLTFLVIKNLVNLRPQPSGHMT